MKHHHRNKQGRWLLVTERAEDALGHEYAKQAADVHAEIIEVITASVLAVGDSPSEAVRRYANSVGIRLAAPPGEGSLIYDGIANWRIRYLNHDTGEKLLFRGISTRGGNVLISVETV